MQKREMKKHLVITILVTLSIILLINFPPTITGFSILEFNNENDFNGIYSNTEYSNQIILSLNNLTGNYTQTINVGKNASWNNIDISFTLPKTEYFFALDEAYGIHSSKDLGLTWTQKTSNYGNNITTGLTIDSKNNLFILAEKQIYKSTNNGINWTLINNQFNPYNEEGLEIETDYNNIYIVDLSGRVFKSEDAITWTELGDFNGISNKEIKGFAINSNNMFAIDKSKAVYHSKDLGLTWTQKTSNYGGTDKLSGLTISNNKLYILDGKQIYKSINNGSTWNLVNSQFNPYDRKGSEILTDTNNIPYISDQQGKIYKSTNEGVNWTEQGSIGENAKGFTNIFRTTNLTYQIRTCTYENCSNEDYSQHYQNSTTLSKTGNYFQFKTYLTSEYPTLTPKIYNITINYTLINILPLKPTLNYPLNNSQLTDNIIQLNTTILDPDNDNLTIWFLGNNNLLQKLENTKSSTHYYNWTINQGTYNWTIIVNDGYTNITSDTYYFNIIQSSSPPTSFGSSSSQVNDIISRTELNTELIISEELLTTTSNIPEDSEILEREILETIQLKTPSQITGLITNIKRNVTSKENGVLIAIILILLGVYATHRYSTYKDENRNNSIQKRPSRTKHSKPSKKQKSKRN